jgi:hypothetical protein
LAKTFWQSLPTHFLVFLHFSLAMYRWVDFWWRYDTQVRLCHHKIVGKTESNDKSSTRRSAASDHIPVGEEVKAGGIVSISREHLGGSAVPLAAEFV